MRKNIIRLGYTFLIVIMIMSNKASAMALAGSTDYMTSIENAFDVTIDRDTFINLYDGNDNVVAYIYQLIPIGYTVISSTTNSVIELCAERNNNYIDFSNIDRKYYYGGPLNYSYETGNKAEVISCLTEEVLDKESIRFTEATDSAFNSNTDSANSTISRISYVPKTLPYQTRTYQYNPDGRCAAVAASIYLMYFHDYINSDYVGQSWVTADGVNFINHLTNNYFGVSTSYWDLRDGINEYYDSLGLDATVKSLLYFNVWSQTVSCINNYKPCILLVNGDPTYGDHFVVVTGYFEYADYYYIVNDGHGSTNVYLKTGYEVALVYPEY